jgi:branched-chain amino acid transport system substrate-binding protein
LTDRIEQMRVANTRRKVFAVPAGSLAVVLALAGCASNIPTASEATGGTAGAVSSTTAPEPTVQSLTQGCANLPQKTAKIGVLVPLGGAFASDTQQVVNAASLASSALNDAGGVCGKDARYKFEVVTGNTNNEESSAVISAAQLLNTTEDLNFVMTSYASTSNFEIDLMAQNKMPYLMSANSEQTAAIISKNPAKYPTIWSRVPSYEAYSTQLPVILNDLEKNKKMAYTHGKSAYIIASSDPYGGTIAKGLRNSFAKNGWNVSGYDEVPYGGVNNWQTTLTHIKQQVPDVIVNTDSTAADQAAFTNQFVASPTSSLLFLQYAPSIPQYSELTGQNGNGVLYNMLGGEIPTLPSAQEITKAYTAKYGVPGYFAVVAYNQAMLYARCVKEVGDPTDRLGIGACFGKLNIMTPAGPLQFDQRTHLALQGDKHIPILFYQIQDQQKKVLTPQQYSGTEFKAPPWLKGNTT